MIRNTSILLAESEKEIAAVNLFRSQIYLNELEKAHLCTQLEKQLDTSAFHLYAMENNKIFMSIRLRCIRDQGDLELKKFKDYQQFNYKRLAIVGRLVVEKSYRNKGGGYAMICSMYQFMVSKNVDIALFEIEPHFLRSYKRFGCHFLRKRYNELGQERIQMYLKIEDKAHFQRTGSPFLALLEESQSQQVRKRAYSVD